MLNRIRHLLKNFLRLGKHYGKKEKAGKLMAMTVWEQWAVLRHASNPLATAREIDKQAGNQTNIRMQCFSLRQFLRIWSYKYMVLQGKKVFEHSTLLHNLQT